LGWLRGYLNLWLGATGASPITTLYACHEEWGKVESMWIQAVSQLSWSVLYAQFSTEVNTLVQSQERFVVPSRCASPSGSSWFFSNESKVLPHVSSSQLQDREAHLNSPIMALSDRSNITSNIMPLADMPRFHDLFEIPREDQHDVDPAWFQRRKQRSVQKNDPSLRDWLAKQVDALKAFQDGHMTAEEASLSMTHPVSTSPIPALGGYSDEILAVNNLWRLIIAALMEWPSARIPDIFTLLSAIGKAPGDIHKGEAVDDEGEKLTWAQFPYFGMSWYECTGAAMQPGQICRQYSDPALVALARKLYLKLKDIEAQLVAKHVMAMNKPRIQFIIRALKKEIDQSDEQVAPDEATGHHQVKLDWHIPAVSFIFKHNGRAIYDRVVTKELGDWTKGQLPDEAREFQNGAERWSF
jgi:hypothetical protein